MRRRETIGPPTGMTPPVGWDSGQRRKPPPPAGASPPPPQPPPGHDTSQPQCPLCGLTFHSTTWTIPDIEAHADACLVATFGGPDEDGVEGGGGVGEDAEEGAGEGDDDDGAGHDGSCSAWLASVGLARFASAFVREELWMRDVPDLTDEDLRDAVGMTRAEDRAIFLAAAAEAAAGGLPEERETGRRYPYRDDDGDDVRGWVDGSAVHNAPPPRWIGGNNDDEHDEHDDDDDDDDV